MRINNENEACNVHQIKEIIFDAIERTLKGRKGKGIAFSTVSDVATSTNKGERIYYCTHQRECVYVQRRNNITRSNCNLCKDIDLIFSEFVKVGRTEKIYLNMHIKKGEK